MLPWLMGKAVELDRAVGKLLPVERQTSAQHAAHVFAGLEHLLENGLALAQRRIWIDTATGGQGQAGQQYNRKSFKSHDGFRSRKNGGQYPRVFDKDQ
ncbi:hypothetical protein D3C75_898410 [compost metagenome]